MNIEDLYPGLDSQTMQELFQAIAPKTKISQTILEKDLYMTGMLLKFLDSLGEEKENVYFKGGTALSKCHKIIQRFSEDCDLFIFTGKGDASRTQEAILNAKITDKLVELFNKDMGVDQQGQPLSVRGGNYNKICINYKKSYPEDLFKPHVEFELTSCPLKGKKGYYVSSQKLDIQPIVGEILYSNGMKEIADRLSLYPRKIKCSTPNKTLCDKISRLIKISYSDDLLQNTRKYIRDFYDITLLVKQPDMDIYLNSRTFMEEMLRTNEEDIARKNSNAGESYAKAAIFNNAKEILSDKTIANAYKMTTEKFCFDPATAPKISNVISTIEKLHPLMVKFDDYKTHINKLAKANEGYDNPKTNSINKQYKPN